MVSPTKLARDAVLEQLRERGVGRINPGERRPGGGRRASPRKLVLCSMGGSSPGDGAALPAPAPIA